MDSLQKIFDEEIILAHKMELKVESYEDNLLILKAPLSSNFNDKKSAFGGSLYSILVLSGWGLLYLKLKEAKIYDADIVIYKADIKYNSATKDDFKALCSIDESEFKNFIEMYKSKKKAKITLTSKVISNSIETTVFTGIYAIYESIAR